MPALARCPAVLLVISLAPSTARGQEGGAAPVSLEVDGTTPARLFQLTADGGRRFMCALPCQVPAPPARYVVEGAEQVLSQPFEITGRNRRVKADVRLADDGLRMGGFLFAYGGGTLASVGLFILPFAFAPIEDSDLAPLSRTDARRVAPVIIGVGVAALILGIRLVQQGRPALELTPLP